MNRALLLAGVVALGAGLAALAAPGVLGFGLPRAVVTLVGILALVQTLRVARARYRVDRRVATTPDPEVPSAAPTPGDDFGDVLDQFLDTRYVFRATRARAGLEAAAVAVLTQFGGRAEEDARELLERGLWTDDPYAVAFLGGDAVSEPALSTRFRSLLTPESTYRRDVRRTIDAIADAAGIDRRSNVEETTGHLDRLRRRFGDAVRSGGGSEFESGSGSRSGSTAGRRRGQPSGSAPDGGRLTERWYGVSAVTLVGIGAGVLAEQPEVVLVGVVGVCYAAYARTNRIPAVALSAERSLDDERPAPGEPVEVTVEVTNDGDRTLPDVRIVDGVPHALSVDDGSPRAGWTLRPGETATVRYTVTARRGVHEFDPLTVVVRNLPGAVEHERRVPAASPTELTCVPSLRPLPVSVPLREGSARYAGTEDTASGGDGTTFFATRDYRPGDPMARIDWNRKARTGALATLVFREERAATVVLVIDASAHAHVAPGPDGGHAVDRSIDAAGRVFATVQGGGNRVGIAALGDGTCWLPPETDPAHRTRARELLATHPALNSVLGESNRHPARSRQTLRRRLPASAQLVLFSPLCRDTVARIAREFEAYGYPVTVVSPDPTADGTPGQRLARVARRIRIATLRSAGIPVVDWGWEEPLPLALARVQGRGSR